MIAIVGPTASGKSALAVRLGRKFGGEIISVDSRQVYRGLDLASGKLGVKERGDVKHHLLDVANLKRPPTGGFTVQQYKKLAEKAMGEILARGRLPIFCGGTGLYLDAVLGRVTIPNVPPNQILRLELEKLSTAELFSQLEILDPGRAENIDVHNRRRLIRAIEIAKYSCQGLTLTEEKGSAWSCLKIGLFVEPVELKNKIKKRLTQRLRSGLIAEIRNLHTHGVSWPRLDDLGLECRYVSYYLRGLINQDAMIEKIEVESWHYAKRQMTWFKRDKNIIWVDTTAAAERLARDFLLKGSTLAEKGRTLVSDKK